MGTVDFAIQSGSVWAFLPVSDAAQEHVDEHMPDDAASPFGAYCVEHRYALPIVFDLINEHGFTVTIDGREVAEITAS